MTESVQTTGGTADDLEKYASQWESLLGRITGRLDRVLGKAVASTNLSTSQCRALLFLLEHEDSTMTVLSRGLVISLSAATGIVDRLIKKQLIERNRDESDRRVVRVRLTDEGGRLAETARDAMRQYTADALCALSEQDRGRLMNLLETIAGQTGEDTP